jgi:hypothetical protein
MRILLLYMKGEFENMWNESAMAYFRWYPNLCLDGLNENTKTDVTITNVPSEVRTKELWLQLNILKCSDSDDGV